jgi:hypothetical protein
VVLHLVTNGFQKIRKLKIKKLEIFALTDNNTSQHLDFHLPNLSRRAVDYQFTQLSNSRGSRQNPSCGLYAQTFAERLASLLLGDKSRCLG